MELRNNSEASVQKRFISYIISFFIFVNVAFTIHQGWKVAILDDSLVYNHGEKTPDLVHPVVFPLENDIEKIKSANIFGHYEPENSSTSEKRYKVSEWRVNTELINNAPESRFAGNISGLLFSNNKKKVSLSLSMMAYKRGTV